ARDRGGVSDVECVSKQIDRSTLRVGGAGIEIHPGERCIFVIVTITGLSGAVHPRGIGNKPFVLPGGAGSGDERCEGGAGEFRAALPGRARGAASRGAGASRAVSEKCLG